MSDSVTHIKHFPVNEQGDIIIENIINIIKTKTPFLFAKFGDGEFNCMYRPGGVNGNEFDKCTLKLSKNLHESFQYIVNNHKNYYIAKWNWRDTIKYYESLTDKKINFARFNSLIMLGGKNHTEGYMDKDKVRIYETIKESSLKKIYICNKSLIKSKELLNIDHLVFIPYNNWFDNHFESVLNNVLNLISEITEDNEPFILMSSCGMSAKVMITEVYKKYNNGIYLDVGNGLDYLCWKDTRGWSNIYTHSYLKELFKNVIGDSKNY